MTHRSLILAAALAVVAAVLLAFTAGRMAPPTPVIAVVDLETALKGLDEAKSLEADLQAKGQEAQNKIEDLDKRIKAVEESIKVLPVGTERRAAVEQGARLLMERKIEVEFQNVTLAQLKSDMLRDVYERLDTAAADLAVKHGYTMVLASDEGVEIKRGQLDSVERTISLKRMLYVQKEHDITDELITYMNNAYATQKNAPPAASAAPKAGGKNGGGKPAANDKPKR